MGESLFNADVGVVLFIVNLEIALLGPADVTIGHTLSVFLRETLGGMVLGTTLGLGTAGCCIPSTITM